MSNTVPDDTPSAHRPSGLDGDGRSTDTASRGQWAVRPLLVLGAVLAALGVVGGHINRTVLDGPSFVDGVDAVRRDDAVATQIGGSMARQVITATPDLVALAPLVEAVSIRIAGGDLLTIPVRRAATSAFVALTEEDADSFALRLTDLGAVVAGVLVAVAPDRAPAAADVSVTLASIGDQSFAGPTLALTRAVGLLSWLLPVLALICLLGAVALSSDRWRGGVAAGWALTWAAFGLGLALAVGGFVVRRLDADTLGGAVGRASWQVFVRPMWWDVLALAAVGIAIVMTCGSVLPATLRSQLTRIRSLAGTRPTSTIGVAVRAGVVGAVGLAALTDPIGTIELAAFFAGVGLVLFALTEIATIAEAARGRRPAETPSVSAPDVVARRGPRPAALVIAGVVGLAAVAGVVVSAQPGREVDAVAVDMVADGCNGHVDLCDRRFDEVAYIASHNAMSVAREPGWFLAEQLDPIPEQLDQGARALLIDVWSGRPAGSVVRTSASSYEEALAVTEAELGPDVVAAAGRIAQAVAGEPEGPEARFLCHGLCETGSTPFVPELERIRDWMAVHPNEVVTLMVEDHVDAALVATDVEAAGMLPMVFQHTPVEPWPTLGEMIGRGQRLVVMVEDGDGGDDAPWLLNAFSVTADTPYTFPTADAFSCAPNRGPADAPLLLVNHWLSGFRSLVTDAVEVNASDVLGPRVRQCQEERGQLPNFIAVNFLVLGDVAAVVDELNGVS